MRHPTGYSRVSTSQLAAADKLVFQKLIEEGTVPARSASGVYPLDTALIQALQSYEVSFAFLPLPSKSESKPKADAPGKAKTARSELRLSNLQLHELQACAFYILAFWPGRVVLTISGLGWPWRFLFR